MNYRHAYHAGNFADVHKHVVLARILTHLKQKPAAFRVIDTHAGAGRYDLSSPEASRGGEWRDGIGLIWQAQRSAALNAFLAPYLDTLSALNPDGRLLHYPGSPLLVARTMRSQDRLIACEIEPQSFGLLQAALRGERGAKTLAIDGWTALGAYVPPKERRGLVLVDPPFEDTTDFLSLSATVAAAHGKWPTGIYCLWYPITARHQTGALARRFQKLGISNILRTELLLGEARRDAGLVGSGLIIVNPPFPLERDLRTFMPMLGQALRPDAVARTDWLARQASPTK
jgi:23S rRNA (adenine2030-N6)-methyltransferase